MKNSFIAKPGILAWGLALALTSASAVHAADPAKTALDKKAVEEIVREVLREQPEIIIEAIESYRAKQEAAKQKQAAEALAAHRGEIDGGEFTPIGGNPNGSVTVVEFFDYHCGYCKRVFPAVLKLMESNENVRLVFKEFPILGPQSLEAAQAALAAWKMDQSKYLPFHTAMMAARGQLSTAKIMRLAKEAGLDPKRLATEMKEPAINAALQKNLDLAQSLNINGTPAFIIGDRIVPGAVSLEDLKRMVAEERKG